MTDQSIHPMVDVVCTVVTNWLDSGDSNMRDSKFVSIINGKLHVSLSNPYLADQMRSLVQQIVAKYQNVSLHVTNNFINEPMIILTKNDSTTLSVKDFIMELRSIKRQLGEIDSKISRLAADISAYNDSSRNAEISEPTDRRIDSPYNTYYIIV